jgi:Flp pilus assembly protein TadD
VRRRAALAAAAALVAAATVAALAPVAGNGFVSWDDGEYLRENRHLTGPFSAREAAWAFTTLHAGNWHPLTWLSHRLDVALFGLDPRGHHLMGLGIHLAASLLLLAALALLTGRMAPALGASLLFALHPLHVESVAWASERKDLLAGLFTSLALLAHARWAARPSGPRYLALWLAVTLGCLSKPTAVTLPVVLLLLDWWPLGRLRRPGAGPWLEKIPLLVPVLAAALLTWEAQRRGGAVSTLAEIPPGMRLANALLSLWRYLGDALFPAGLSFFYPYPQEPIPAAAWSAALGGAAAVTLLALRLRRTRPWLLTGWAWYLAVLLPTLGIVQAGLQARADRYTYLSLTGLFLGLAWGADRLAAGRARRASLPALALAVGLLAVLARGQAATWRDSETLFRHALRVDPGNWLARYDLATIVSGRGEKEEARRLYREVLRGNPGHAGSWYNLGLLEEERGNVVEALERYRQAVDLDPAMPEPWINLGALLMRLGRDGEAAAALTRGGELAPRHPVPRFNLGLLLARGGDWAGAEAAFRDALRLSPDYQRARVNLGRLLVRRGRVAEAGEEFRLAADGGIREALCAWWWTSGTRGGEAEGRCAAVWRDLAGQADGSAPW